jgi:hypothetical protein
MDVRSIFCISFLFALFHFRATLQDKIAAMAFLNLFWNGCLFRKDTGQRGLINKLRPFGENTFEFDENSAVSF